MFKNLLQFWKGKDFLSQVLEEFKDMLSTAEDIFNCVSRKLIHNEDIPGLEDKVYEGDKKINRMEKEIRKRVAEHMLIQPSVDAAACLLLMSVVKDAERLGDYCKNLYEVVNLLNFPIDKSIYQNLFNGMDKQISELFKQTKDAFIESNETKAVLSWDYETKIVKRCDAIIKELARSNLSVNGAVCLTLIARHFKRLSAHLANIATSVILPIDELDYFDEKRKGGQDEQK